MNRFFEILYNSLFRLFDWLVAAPWCLRSDDLSFNTSENRAQTNKTLGRHSMDSIGIPDLWDEITPNVVRWTSRFLF